VKKLLLGLALLFNLGLPVLAEPAKQPPKVKTIFEYQKEIGLTDDQIAKMKGELQTLQTNVTNSRAKLKALEDDFTAIIKAEGSAEEAEAKLKEIAAATVTMRLNDFATSKRINGIMSAEQKQKWRAIQASLRQQAPVQPPK